jgi:hypothetical protein
MLSKIILSLFTATLIATSTAIAMDNNSDRRYIMHQKLLQKNDKKYTTGYKRVLNLYEDQIEYHKDMKILENNQKNNLNRYEIFGHSIKKIMIEHENSITELFNGAQDLEGGILEKIAYIYCYATANGIETEDQIKDLNLQKNTILQDDLSDESYQMKILEDTHEFCKRVQITILTEFEKQLPQIFKDMINFAEVVIKSWNKPKNKKVKLKNGEQFYDDVFNKKYKFPSLKDLKLAELPIEELNQNEEEIVTKVITKNQDNSVQFQVAQLKPNQEKNKKKNERKKLKKIQKRLANQNSSQDTSVMSAHPEKNVSSDALPEHEEHTSSLLEEANNQSIENVTSSQNTEENSILISTNSDPKNIEVNSVFFIEDKNDQVDKVSTEQISNEEIAQKTINELREKKKKKNIFIKNSDKQEKNKKGVLKIKNAEINKHNHGILIRILETPIDLKIRWSNIVNLFNSLAGMKGKVFGKKNGSAHTFEVYLKFKEGILTEFLSENDFNKLKETANPQLKETRNFLQENTKLSCYQLLSGESIATSCFTLHNPHPKPFAYEALVERLQGQLNLLGITSETVKPFNSK